jgi:parvulin-like peptidyl-prolyl isomerase
MTFRTRQPAKPTRRRSRQIDTRRSIYMNLSFGLAVVVAVAVLGGVVFANWSADHWATVSTVNGQTINKDAIRARAAVDLARYDRELVDYGKLEHQGTISATDFGNLQTTVTNNEVPATLYQNALSELQGEAVLQQYADKNGISVTDAQINAAIQQDASIPEMRHVKIIGVAPSPTAPATVPTDSDMLTALAKVQTDLAAITAITDPTARATKWDDTFTAEGTAGSSGTTGDLGLTSKDGLNLDPNLADAIFGLKKVGDITGIIKGSDGIFRFATVTEIVPASNDSGWQAAIVGASSSDGYNSAAHGAAVKQAIKDSVQAKYVTGSTTQRQVQEIALSPGYGAAYDPATKTPGDGDEVKIRLMIFAPNNSVSGAAALAATDPAWAAAEKRAQAAVDKLKADPSQFDTMAKDTKTNDDTNFNAQGGEAPWLSVSMFGTGNAAQTGLGYTNIQAKLFAGGIAANTIIGPVQEPSAGYIVAEFIGRRPAPDDRIAQLALELSAGQIDFSTAAKTQSESSDASSGGDMGWVSPYMLSKQMQDAIFATPVGQVSQIIVSMSTSSDPTTGAPTTVISGYWLFKVNAEQTRVADKDQQLKLAKVVFPLWLDQLNSTAQITTDQAALTALSATTSTAASAT